MARRLKRQVQIIRPDGSTQTYNSQLEAAKTEPLTQPIISKMCRKGAVLNGYSAKFVGEESSPAK